VQCADPAALFSSKDDPRQQGQRLMALVGLLHWDHLELPGADVSRPLRRLPDWAKIRAAILADIRQWTKQGQRIPASFLAVLCFTSPPYAAAFGPYAEAVLTRPTPPGARHAAELDPGFVKQAAVHLVVAAPEQRTLTTLLRFVRSGQRVGARMKAVRDLCAAAALPEVRATLDWVLTSDSELRNRVVRCRETWRAQGWLPAWP
jgi:hypothetical protein